MAIICSQHLCAASRGSHGSAAERIRQDDVIYEVHKDKNYIVYATKEKLLKSLVDPRTGVLHFLRFIPQLTPLVDMDYITQYLATHLWHTTSAELLDRLIGMYPNSSTCDVMKYCCE
jgi:hypothetical protein